LLLLAIGVAVGYALSMLLAGGTARAQEATTGVEAVRTDVLEAAFTPGASRQNTEVWFRGSGFVPGTDITILVKDGNGVLTDINVPAEARRDGGGTVYPLIVNDDGAWATNWMIGRFSRPDVGAEGMFTVWVTDSDFNILATTPLALCNHNRAEGETIPAYCSQ
jgi:hypothetical protein